MNFKELGTLMVVDNESESIHLAKDTLDKHSETLLIADSPERALEILDSSMLDVILLDICLKHKDPDEPEKLDKNNKSIAELAELAQISGIKLLSLMRYKYPRLPIVLWTGYGKSDVEKLQQHAVGVIEKAFSNRIRPIIWLAQRVVIGIRFPQNITERKVNLVDEIRKLLEKINQQQRYYWFFYCQTLDDLIKPPAEIPGNNELEAFTFVSAWNKRIVAILDESPSTGDEFCPILPFGTGTLDRYITNVLDQAEFLSWKLFPALLARELTRIAYRVSCKIEGHVPATRKCIFDDSGYFPYLVSGIHAPEICPKCTEVIEKAIDDKQGWFNRQKVQAVEAIHQIARDSLDLD
jgi:CheY-like chemotaxis protein